MIIIAELGTNTGGSLERALAMVDAAAEAGCDGVKVQAYETGDFLPEGHPDWDMFEANRLSWEQIEFVQKQAIQNDLLFGATPTSLDGVRRLAALKVDFLKNGSDYLLRHDMIQAMLDTGIETWVSTGMATWDEIWDAPIKNKKETNFRHLMGCTSLYPCPDDQAALGRLRDCHCYPAEFSGYSDHTEGIEAAVVCATLRIGMYEKHFTLDRSLPGPDHWFSVDPEQMAQLVRSVRRAEAMMGYRPEMSAEELANRDKWRVTVEQPLRG